MSTVSPTAPRNPAGADAAGLPPAAVPVLSRPGAAPSAAGPFAWPLAGPLLVAALLPLLAFAFSADIGLNLLDEGFVWYGAQRVLAGELPLRDFQSYDPARYFWSAAWMALAGSHGIIPLRAGNAVLTAGVVVAAVLLVRRGAPRHSPALLVVAAFIFFVWRVPAYKAADSAAVLLLVAGLAGVIAQCTARRAALFGVCLGVASTIGINHALYGTVAGLLTAGWLRGVAGRRLGHALPAAAAGVVIGYAPVLALHVLAPGFSAGFVDSIRILVEAGTTNVARALPRLSAAWLGEGPLAPALRESLQAATAAAALAFLLAGGVALLRPSRTRSRPTATLPPSPLPPVFVAALLTSVPYAHHVLSRFELPHLAVSVLPVLLAAFTAPVLTSVSGVVGRCRRIVRAVALAAVALASVVIAGPDHAIYQLVNRAALQPVKAGHEILRLREPAASEVRLIEQAVALHAAPDRAIYAAPYWPAAYALTHRRSPTWESYAIFPATAARQRREIERIAAADVALAIVTDARIDERDDMGLAQTHPLLLRHLNACMTPLAPAADGVPRIAGVTLMVGRPGGCRRFSW